MLNVPFSAPLVKPGKQTGARGVPVGCRGWKYRGQTSACAALTHTAAPAIKGVDHAEFDGRCNGMVTIGVLRCAESSQKL